MDAMRNPMAEMVLAEEPAICDTEVPNRRFYRSCGQKLQHASLAAVEAAVA